VPGLEGQLIAFTKKSIKKKPKINLYGHRTFSPKINFIFGDIFLIKFIYSS